MSMPSKVADDPGEASWLLKQYIIQRSFTRLLGRRNNSVHGYNIEHGCEDREEPLTRSSTNVTDVEWYQDGLKRRRGMGWRRC